MIIDNVKKTNKKKINKNNKKIKVNNLLHTNA